MAEIHRLQLRRRGLSRAGVVGVAIVALFGVIAVMYVVRSRGRNTDAGGPATQIATTGPATSQAATQPATTKAAVKPPTTRYFDVVKLTYPKMAATQPLGAPVTLNDAARLVIEQPVYLSPRRDIWVTHAEAPPAEQQIKLAEKLQADGQVTIATSDEVAYVHWRPTQRGPWTFDVVVRKPDGSFDVVTSKGRKAWGGKQKGYDWARAVEWNDDVIVPTAGGIAVVRLAPEQAENFVELVEEKAGEPLASATRFLFDWDGFLAWAPPEPGKRGSRGAVRFVGGQWALLKPEEGWPARPVQLLPLTDGSVMTIDATDDADGVKLSTVTLAKRDVDEKVVLDLVDQLSDEDPKKREGAFQALAGYGQGVWPILEKVMELESPESKIRLRQLMKSRVAPTLGGMTLIGGKLQALSRHADGGGLFYAPSGVSIPSDAETPDFRNPAWIDVNSGPWVSLLEYAMTRDLAPQKSRVQSVAGDWVVTDANGAKLFVGNGFVPLLRKDETAFDQIVGRDGRGRWLFRKSGEAKGPTLILDPTIPDPTPRLPVWVYDTAETVGWDPEDWPAVKRGGAWVLKESGWSGLDEAKSKLMSTAEDVPPPRRPKPPATQSAATLPSTTKPTTVPVAATTRSSTAPATTTAATSAPVVDTEQTPLLMIDADGARYHDGVNKLIVVDAAGRRTAWDLPAIATGSGRAWLVRAKDGALYLFNQPGRVLRIKRTPDGAQPFEVEATLSKRIPSTPKLTRVWLDPANRIVMAYGSQLAILFPDGYIPPPIVQMMPADQLELDGR